MNAPLILIISIIALLWAANHLVSGASYLSNRMHIPPFLAGFTLIALCTTTPEIILAFVSSLKNKEHYIIGNAIGINIANIGLILGISILINPIIEHAKQIKKIYPLIIIFMLFVYSLMLDDILGKIDGCLLLIACIFLIVGFIYFAYSQNSKDGIFHNFKNVMYSTRSLKINILSLIIGLTLLPVSTKYLIQSATEIAKWFDLNYHGLELTFIALSMTLPGLISAVIAALKGEEDLASGTILGSNVYSLLLILASPTILLPTKTNSIILWQELPLIISLTVLLLFLNFYYKKRLSAWDGGILIIIYCSYVISLIIKN